MFVKGEGIIRNPVLEAVDERISFLRFHREEEVLGYVGV